MFQHPLGGAVSFMADRVNSSRRNNSADGSSQTSKGLALLVLIVGIVLLALLWNAVYYPDLVRTPLLIIGVVMILGAVWWLAPTRIY